MEPEDLERCKELCRYDEFMGTALEIGETDQKALEDFIPEIMEMVVGREEKDPVEMYEGLIDDLAEKWPASPQLPVHGGWHHFIVPGIILAVLRNNGYDFTDEDVREAMKRGAMLPGGACGFHGICGAGTGLGIAMSIVHRSTPLHQEERSAPMEAASEVFRRIAKLGGPRCCVLSTYTTLNMAVRELRELGYEIPLSHLPGRCPYYLENEECHGKDCPYYPR
ncbi:MAG: DUF5714 domain-containing protein [Methanomassiliicoccales archaeon]